MARSKVGARPRSRNAQGHQPQAGAPPSSTRSGRPGRNRAAAAIPSGNPPALLRQLGLSARKALSQSFLMDESVCRQMADWAAVGPDDEVLEIGPGLGILTRQLVTRAKRVVAVELDPKLAEHLPNLVGSSRLHVVHDDALAFDPASSFTGPYKLVANLPYQISSPVLHRYLLDVRRPRVLVVMLQREVAERIAAAPGRASYLSILVQSVADVRLMRRVPPGAFYPRPQVTSAVLEILPQDPPDLVGDRLEAFVRFVRAGFAQPRKTLANSLAQGLNRCRSNVGTWIDAAGLDPRKRPQELGVADWLRLLDAHSPP